MTPKAPDQEPSPSSASALNARRLVLVGLTTCLASLAGFWVSQSKPTRAPEPEASHDSTTEQSANTGAARVISLSAGVTQTLTRIGASEKLVGVSDYCELPEGSSLSRVGSSLTPNYEKIAELSPTLILTSDVKGEQLAPLKKLAPTLSLPWLTLQEWPGSIEKLGQAVGHTEQAKELGTTLLGKLNVTPPDSAPKILFVFNYGDTGSNDIWFIRRNSIHGAVLHAAGAKNAVERDVTGPPKLSPEQLVELDPEGILIMRAAEPGPDEKRAVEAFTRWKPLRAVKEGRIAVVSVPGALTIGPHVLDLIAPVQARIESMMQGTTSD